uniref:Lysis regulatory protein n=1 Tax=Podoviridae sp. ctz6O13 TaxID=2827757 RepID=A0A8S5TK77_9CAUD|nr:MAG TPA: hypothetical protein [Podoviridae sp. ctz6O13]
MCLLNQSIMHTIKSVMLLGIVMLSLVSATTVMYHKYKHAIAENDRLQSNLEYYETKESGDGHSNIVLRHTLQELSSSRDSIIRKVDSLRNVLKIKPKRLNSTVYVQTVLRDTLRDTIPVTKNFKAVFKPNVQTTITVERKDCTLTVIPDIVNEQTLFIYSEPRYRYKNWFSRLIHFNFKKVKVDKYVINNSNDLIKSGETRVVNVEK